jgi:hypothetical protein
MTPATAGVAFNFDGKVDGLPYPSLSPADQQHFKAEFFGELASLRAWSSRHGWQPGEPADLQVFVSDEYRISKALLPASVGRRGRMEFPAWRVVAGEAAIMHELVHVYFPNGNRLLAEGLAIYLQATIGKHPAFPNFGRPLNDVLLELLPKMIPELGRGDPGGLAQLRVANLDRIATPSPLRLRVGLTVYQGDGVGQAHLYPIAGSLVQFLIDSYGLERFHEIYARTPLRPFERNAGSIDRWIDVYGQSLDELERHWRSQLAGQYARLTSTVGARP